MYIKTISVIVLQLGWMCREGKSSGQYSPGYLYHCKLCGGSYHATDWEALKPVEPKGAQTTTMGGDSKGDSSSDNEVHTIVLTVYPNKTFGYKLDGGPTNMSRVMDMMSKALEDWNAEFKHQPALKWWSPGTQAAYERLGRALGVAVPAPAAMNTEELSQQHTVNELLCAAHRRIKSLTMPLHFDADAKLHAKCVFDTVCGEDPLVSIDDLKRFSLQELLAYLNGRTEATKAAGGSFDGGVHVALRELHERVCGSATPPVCVHPPGECVRLPVKPIELYEQVGIATLFDAAIVAANYEAKKKGRCADGDWATEEQRGCVECLHLMVCGRQTVSAPTEPLKLAQRLAAFVDERAALEQATRSWFDANVKDLPAATGGWDASMIRLILTAAMSGRRVTGAVAQSFRPGSWEAGGAIRRVYEDAGFGMILLPDITLYEGASLSSGRQVSMVSAEF